MKPTISLLLLASLFQVAPVKGGPAEGGRVQMRDAVTNAEMAQSHRNASMKDPLKDLGEPIGKTDVDPAKDQHSRDFIKESTVLSFRGALTLVPKRSVLFVPDALMSRVGVQANAKVQTWGDFRNANRGWIRCLEVSREQALGAEPLPEAVTEAITTSTSIVIATFKDGPISVLPLKTPEELEAAAAAEKAKPGVARN